MSGTNSTTPCSFHDDDDCNYDDLDDNSDEDDNEQNGMAL